MVSLIVFKVIDKFCQVYHNVGFEHRLLAMHVPSTISFAKEGGSSAASTDLPHASPECWLH